MRIPFLVLASFLKIKLAQISYYVLKESKIKILKYKLFLEIRN